MYPYTQFLCYLGDFKKKEMIPEMMAYTDRFHCFRELMQENSLSTKV